MSNAFNATLVADGHVHVYPAYDLGAVFSAIDRNLSSLAGRLDAKGTRIVKAAFLAERSDCRFFSEWCKRPPRRGEYTIRATAGKAALLVRRGSEPAFYLLAGRQIVTSERIELLGLIMAGEVPDGVHARATLERIRAAGGIPVLAWAPGKWWFRRGRTVRALLNTSKAADFMLGDTTLRPTLWLTPGLMRRARRMGHRIVAGSDPLPFAGEERVIGTYGFSVPFVFDESRPADSLRDALQNGGPIRFAGRRGGLSDVLRRLAANQAVRKNAKQ